MTDALPSLARMIPTIDSFCFFFNFADSRNGVSPVNIKLPLIVWIPRREICLLASFGDSVPTGSLKRTISCAVSVCVGIFLVPSRIVFLISIYRFAKGPPNSVSWWFYTVLSKWREDDRVCPKMTLSLSILCAKIKWIIFHCLHSTHKDIFCHCIRPSGGCHAVAGGYRNILAAGTCGKLLDLGKVCTSWTTFQTRVWVPVFSREKISFAFCCHWIPMKILKEL